MWLVHNTSGEEGWHIPQVNQPVICPLLVFVKDGGLWRTKLWMTNETRIRPKNHAEEVKDDYDMVQRGFMLGFTKTQITMKRCLQCSL